MIVAGAMLLQCRPRTSAFSKVPSRISMKSYLRITTTAGVIPNASNAFPRQPEESDHVERDGSRRGREMKGERPPEDKHR